QIKSWVAQGNGLQGLDMGGVADIDDAYGVGDVTETLDMKLLFKPYERLIDSPVGHAVMNGV
ncbi:hypothetical protein LTR66_016272, partial [Elasticomyces elasticus]